MTFDVMRPGKGDIVWAVADRAASSAESKVRLWNLSRSRS